MSEQEMQMKLASQQGKVEALRQEVSSMNKEQELWQQVRIQVSAAMLCELSGYMFSAGYSEKQVAEQALKLADALIAELKKGGEDDNNN